MESKSYNKLNVRNRLHLTSVEWIILDLLAFFDTFENSLTDAHERKYQCSISIYNVSVRMKIIPINGRWIAL